MHARACLLVVPLLLQACQAASGGAEQTPVLEFPEAGVDDPAAYEGYVTRFFRDASGNTFQVYLNQRDGRVVHVWADAANESAAFTVRDAEGRAAPLEIGDLVCYRIDFQHGVEIPECLEKRGILH